MNNISTKYDPSIVETKWYDYWLEHKFFASKKDEEKEPFTIVIPPPNVTGILHMGHILNNTIQDILIRKARMEGKNACWVPGTDHASIATEAKVVKMLREQGIKKSDIGREKFLEHAFEWKEKYGGLILSQLQRLGASCDWDRTCFTMDEERSKHVINMFVHLYEKGYIYRGLRIVNWDPDAKTVLSKEEVIHKDVHSKLYYVKYAIKDSDEFITVATTRPETIMGDTAICIHPKDERYLHLHGKTAIVPMVNREIPIIADDYIDPEFGTGCLKVTPAHDENDYNIGKKHNLETIDVLNDDGTISEAGQFFVGEDRFIARKKMGKELDKIGSLLKIDDYDNQVGTSERTGAVVEPKLSEQWFISMKELTKPALEHVLNDDVQFNPPMFKNMYKSWVENIQDWNISRQLWWGHQIPAYYLPDGQIVVATTFEEALSKAQVIQPDLKATDLKQDEDVLDTWSSSWLWPMSVFADDEVDYYYPTSVLVTGFDIIFFWVMRMIIAGYELKGEKPFNDVYFTGMVRDKQRRKMSKSLGNSPDVFKLMDKYSTDGVRYGILSSSAAGNDIIFDSDVPRSQKPEDLAAFAKQEPESKLCETGRNFANKIWNAFRLVKSWEVDKSKKCPNTAAIDWFDAKLNETLAENEGKFDSFRLSDAMVSLYKLIWGDFCSKYLEMIKPDYDQEKGQSLPTDPITLSRTLGYLDKLMRLLHPFMPFITEEVWQTLKERGEKETICLAPYPKPEPFDANILSEADEVFEVIQGINNIRNTKQLKKSLELALYANTSDASLLTDKFLTTIQKLAKISTVTQVSEKMDGAAAFMVKDTEYYIPLSLEINVEEEKERLQKELAYQQGFLKGVSMKLSNERFVSNAPDKVVAIEVKKKEDAEAKIKAIEESLSNL